MEDHVVKELEKKGWKYVPADALERESFEEPLLTPVLVRSMKKLNSGLAITDEEIKKVLDSLKLVSGGPEGGKKILNYLKQGVPVKFEKERTIGYVKLFDFDPAKLDANDFIVTKQVVFKSSVGEIRTDVLLFVNGIPLVNIECKNPASMATGWQTAYKQIKGYEKTVPELYKYVQVGVATGEATKYFPIVPWQDEVKTHAWKADKGDHLDDMMDMLEPKTLLDIIRNFLFVRAEAGTQTKAITRYMQYRAVNKIVDRVLNNLEGRSEKRKGLIWHWQGSGKTLEMIFAAYKLYHAPLLENPSIFFIIDRLDLEAQLFDEFTALDVPWPEIISNIGELRRALKHDDYRGKRGMMITLIHKFRVEELNEVREELVLASKERETILTRKNVIAFVDEGHRTQYGVHAAQMKDLLRGAFFFAFTGTPISKPGHDTYQTFSHSDEKYLDRYFISESIRDGFTVKIAYQPRLEDKVHLDKAMLNTFLEIEDEEIPEEIREEVKEKAKGKLRIVHFLEDESRIKIIAEDIAKHFKENIDGRFKAMVVAVNRKSCVRYKRELDKLLPKEYSEVVMSFNETTDTPLITGYLSELRARFKGNELDEIREEIINKFDEEELPKILIVTDMLLTGFDAPVLQTMYLDKPLKEHRLLQAIARTNRPYKGVKEAGLIIDYIGILDEFHRAFEMYSEEEIKGVVLSSNDLRAEFRMTMDGILKLFAGISTDKTDRETMLKAIEILTSNEEKGKEFLESYRALRRLYELLGPDVIKARLFSEYEWISSVYIYYLRTVLRGGDETQQYVDKYFEKTLKILRKTMEFGKLEDNLPIINFDEDYLKRLKEKIESKEEKAANIVFTLNRCVLVDKQSNPIFESLADKVERLLNLWRERTKDYERIYQKGVEIISELANLQKRQKELGFSKLEYSILLLLEKEFEGDSQIIDDIKELSKEFDGIMFTGWSSQPTARKNVERTLRKFLRRYMQRHNITLEKLGPIYSKLLEYVIEYGK